MQKNILFYFSLFAFIIGCSKESTVNSITQTPTILANSSIPIFSYNIISTTESAVSISCDTSGAAIRYTLDGSEPTSGSALYTTPIDITTEDEVINAKSFLNGINSSSASKYQIPKALTIMYYGDADNNLESYLLTDVQEMKDGYTKAGYNVITLFDRISGESSNSTVFGEDFTDTRLYKIGKNSTTRIGGSIQFPEITTTSNYEANMGDANTLKKFINFCKANYPAQKYVLIMSNHGGGTRSNKSSISLSNKSNTLIANSKSSISKTLSPAKTSTTSKGICWDDSSSDDCLYTGEMTDVLNSSQSVDVMVLDACLMGSVEFAYQFRPNNGSFSANYLVASPALVRGEGLPYENIFKRLSYFEGDNNTTNSLTSGNEKFLIPSTMPMADFSNMIVEEQYDDTLSDSSQTFSAYNLNKMNNLKSTIDQLAVSIDTNNEKISFEDIRGTGGGNSSMNYFDSSSEYEWTYSPFYDLYDLVRCVENSPSFSAATKFKASLVKNALAEVIMTSFGGSDFINHNDNAIFENNKNGMHIVFPKYSVTDGTDNFYSLAFLDWYTPVDIKTLSSGNTLYGNLTFCSGGTSNNTVENWFELIDKWYDYTGVNSGKGFNYYKY